MNSQSDFLEQEQQAHLHNKKVYRLWLRILFSAILGYISQAYFGWVFLLKAAVFYAFVDASYIFIHLTVRMPSKVKAYAKSNSEFLTTDEKNALLGVGFKIGAVAAIKQFIFVFLQIVIISTIVKMVVSIWI